MAALRRKASMAQVDMLKYRRVFDLFDRQRKGHILASDLVEVSLKLGYRISENQFQVGIHVYTLCSYKHVTTPGVHALYMPWYAIGTRDINTSIG